MKGISYAGEYDISQLKLFTAAGNVIDLSSTYQQLDIYENMFSNALTGTLLITDTNNIVMNAPITGQEFLSFKITTPGLDNVSLDFTENLMVVYKIDARIAERGNEVFQLHFCSPESLRDDRTRLSKSYVGNVSDIVKKVLKDPKALNTNKELFIEKTKGIKKIISPNKNPYSLIRDLTTDAISINGSPNYVFFENTDGIHFRTLDSLYAQGSIGDFIASDKGSIDFQKGGITNIEEDLKRVLDYNIVSNNDTKKNIKSGMLASKTISYNIFQKNYSVRRYDYFSDFNKYSRVSNDFSYDNPIYNKAPIDEYGNNLGDFKDARIFLHSKSEDLGGKDAQHYYKGGEVTTYETNDVAKTISHRFAKHTELDFGVKINMEINGNTTINTGSVIDFLLPISGKKHVSIDGVINKDTFDIYNSGKFLITKSRHSFTSLGKRHKIYLSAVKDSFQRKLPEGTGDAIEPRG